VSYEDLREFLDPDLYLPIGGKRYRVESPSAREGLRLRVLLLGDGMLDSEQEVAELRKLMSTAFDEMRADGVKWPEIVHAGRTALLHYGITPEAAERYWRGGGDDEGNPYPPEPETVPGVTVPKIRPCQALMDPTIPAAANISPTTA
jgi:hypothetical protein